MPNELGALGTPPEVAEYLHITTAALAQDRYKGTDPKFIKGQEALRPCRDNGLLESPDAQGAHECPRGITGCRGAYESETRSGESEPRLPELLDPARRTVLVAHDNRCFRACWCAHSAPEPVGR